jgi:hypothetical protein
MEIKEMCSQKVIYDKCIASVILNKEKLKPFPLKSRVRHECPFSPLFFSIVFENNPE